MEADGDGVVVHGLRGRSSNRQIDLQTQARAIVLLKQPEWYDFGPTFASEQLAKRHDIRVSKETVRGWMVAAGLWKAQSCKLGEAHFWRPRGARDSAPRDGLQCHRMIQERSVNARSFQFEWDEVKADAARCATLWRCMMSLSTGGRSVLWPRA